MKIISMIEKVRAPSGIEFHEGLGWWSRARIELARKVSLVFLDSDTPTLVSFALLFVGNAEAICEITKLFGCQKGLIVGLGHFSLLKAQFSWVKLPQRLSVFLTSDNAINVAYYGVEVKLNKKSASLLFCV